MTETPPHSVDGEIADLVRRYETPLRVSEVLCDRHVRRGGIALVYDSPTATISISFDELAARSRNLAAALAQHGIVQGARVAVLLPRSPQLLIALLAIWRLGAVQVPLFTAFGPDAVAYRVKHSGAMALITDSANRDKIEPTAENELVVVCVGEGQRGDINFEQAAETPGQPDEATLGPDDPFILLYTSGTTGKAKGVPVPVRALASFDAYMTYAIDLRHEDVFWNVSDPGWGYGLWYGLVGPLLHGHATILRAGNFDPAGALDTMERLGVTNLAGSPTFFRALRNHGIDPALRARTRLRAASSAGEPLGPGLLDWSARELGTPIHDHYGQSETGMVIGFSRNPQPAAKPRPGHMGRSLPGFRAVVLDPHGNPAAPGQPGDLALDTTASPLFWFTGYYRSSDQTAERYPHGPRYYVTGDTARLSSDGDFVSATRADDVINSSGYRIGPADVEDALRTHAGIKDVAVFGTPDAYRGEAVTAAIVLTDGHTPSGDLVTTLQMHVRQRLGKHLYPRRILFLEDLPRTPSGKVKRDSLRLIAREPRPENDCSPRPS
jgi:acetyl-CoA synthetase